MPTQKREVKRNYIVSDESEQQCAAEARRNQAVRRRITSVAWSPRCWNAAARQGNHSSLAAPSAPSPRPPCPAVRVTQCAAVCTPSPCCVPTSVSLSPAMPWPRQMFSASGHRAARLALRTFVASHGRSRHRAAAFVLPESGLSDTRVRATLYVAVLYEHLAGAVTGFDEANAYLISLRINCLHQHGLKNQIVEVFESRIWYCGYGFSALKARATPRFLQRSRQFGPHRNQARAPRDRWSLWNRYSGSW
jgi:hypothetical protein